MRVFLVGLLCGIALASGSVVAARTSGWPGLFYGQAPVDTPGLRFRNGRVLADCAP